MDDNASKDWQPCDAKWSNDATLTIPKVDICNEGSYRCVVSNIAGDQTSKPAKLEVCSFDATSTWIYNSMSAEQVLYAFVHCHFVGVTIDRNTQDTVFFFQTTAFQ